MTRVFAFIAVLAAVALGVWLLGNHLFVSTRVEPAPSVMPVQKHFPNHDENEAASRFLATVTRFDEDKLHDNRGAYVDYIRAEVQSPKMESAPPPAHLAKFLTENAAAIHAMRAQLASNPMPLWKQRAEDLLETPQPDVILLTHVCMMLSADALAQHAAHADAGAWSDLGAAWVLTRSLWARPEVSSVLAGLTGSRLIVAVATKLPAPAPAWWKDFATFDVRTPLSLALEYEAWAVRTRADKYPAGELNDDNAFEETVRRTVEPFARPIQILEADARARDLRELMRDVKTMDPCAELPLASRARWTSTLRRFNRFLIEREGVAKLLELQEQRAKNAAWPPKIADASSCAGQRWVYEANAEGMQLRFGGHIANPETRIITPLEYRR